MDPSEFVRRLDQGEFNGTLAENLETLTADELREVARILLQRDLAEERDSSVKRVQSGNQC
jgi:hypothetical protein